MIIIEIMRKERKKVNTLQWCVLLLLLLTVCSSNNNQQRCSSQFVTKKNPPIGPFERKFVVSNEFDAISVGDSLSLYRSCCPTSTTLCFFLCFFVFFYLFRFLFAINECDDNRNNAHLVLIYIFSRYMHFQFNGG